MKKTIITSISLLLISFYQIKAQQTYMPVFGNDTTTFYYNIYVGNIVSAFYKQNWIKKNNSNMYIQSEKDNHHLQGYEVGVGDSIEVSSDNSKIWVHEFYNKIKTRTLVMDLNLKIGDNFSCPINPDFSSYTVQDVTTINGRKHIVFAKKIDFAVCVKCDGTDYVVYREFALKFIEGIGPNISFMTCFPKGESREGVPILCAQNKDGVLSYGIPELYPYWGLDGVHTALENTNIPKLNASPIPVDKLLELSLPDIINYTNAVVFIINVSGILQLKYQLDSNKTSIDLSSLSSGVYLVEVNADNYKEVIKIIKR